MTRAKAGIVSKSRHKKIIKLAKGYRGRAKNCFRIAIEKVEKGLQYAYRESLGVIKYEHDFTTHWVKPTCLS